MSSCITTIKPVLKDKSQNRTTMDAQCWPYSEHCVVESLSELMSPSELQ